MSGLLPGDIAILILGESGAALGRQLRAALPGARLHGPRSHPGDWDETYERASIHIGQLFERGQSIIGVCASGILIRSIAALLGAKREEPAVVAVAEDGSVAVPLVGGHRGANALARAVAEFTGGVAAITTAGDLRLGLALDEPPAGWKIADPARVKPVVGALLNGTPVALKEEAAGAGWLRAGAIRWTGEGAHCVVVTDRAASPKTDALVFHPPILALGIGCERGCSPEEIWDLAHSTLAAAGLSPKAVAAIVSIELKLAEAGIHALAAELGAPARFFPASRLLAETSRLSERSAAAFRATGCWGLRKVPHSPPPGATECSSPQSESRIVRPARLRGRPSRLPRPRLAGLVESSPSLGSVRAILPGAPPRRAQRWRRQRTWSATAFISICSGARSGPKGCIRARSARKRRGCASRSTSPRQDGRWRSSPRGMPGFTVWRRSSSNCSTAR